MKHLMNDLYVVSELADDEELGDESFEGFFTRFFNWDPVRLRSSWKRLTRPSRKYLPISGSRVEIQLLSDTDEYTLDLSTRGNKVVTDLASEVLFEVSLLIESAEVLEDNVLRLRKDPENFELALLPLFNRPLLGARSITPHENEMDLIAQGNEIKERTSSHRGYGMQGGHLSVTKTTESWIDRSGDERALRNAGTYWNTSKTQDVVKALRMIEPIVSRNNLITKDMVNAKDSQTKRHMRMLLIWQEILYEQAYFLVHRVSKLLSAVE